MAFNRDTIKKGIRRMSGHALRAMSADIAKHLGVPKPITLAAARALLYEPAAAPRLKNYQPAGGRGTSPRTGGGSGGFFHSPPPPLPVSDEPPFGPESELAGGSFSTQREPPLPGEMDGVSVEILTPESSNVFAFQYDYGASQLLVTYQAHALNPDSVTKGVEAGSGRRRASRGQLLGRAGSTVGRKTGQRGPVYAYIDVPVRVFDNMKRVNSKGKFVWDTLRVRGTIHGHKYRYVLLHGQVTPGAGGVYIPRKATPKGFRSRAVADLGSGQRGFQTSTLPQQSGFRTRSAPQRR